MLPLKAGILKSNGQVYTGGKDTIRENNGLLLAKGSERLKILRELLITSLAGVLGHIASSD